MATFSDPVRGGFSARIAQLELEYFEVESDIIGGKLGFSVSFPEGYDPEGPQYPVVYALDSQWQGGLYEKMHRGLTGPEGAHEVKPFVQINIGYIDEGVDALAVRNRDLLPPGEPCPDFMRDYITEMFGSNPEIVEQFFEWIENPHADHFLNFLETELSIYALTAGSTLFTNFGAGSPGILVPNSTVFDLYRQFAANPENDGRPRRLHVTLGTGEILGPHEFYRLLGIEVLKLLNVMRNEPVEGFELTAKIFEGEDHETGCIDAYRSFARTCYPVWR